jgi:RecB family exonuclease
LWEPLSLSLSCSPSEKVEEEMAEILLEKKVEEEMAEILLEKKKWKRKWRRFCWKFLEGRPESERNSEVRILKSYD